jgi:hypothetical protein
MHKSFKALFATLWRHQWAVVGILACCAFLLALKGLYDLKGGQDWSWPEAIYFALRLYGFNYDLGGEPGDPYAGGNWQLWVASFLAPASTGLAIAKAVATWTAARIDDWHISHLKDHAIICGAGERGRHLALSLRKQKNRRVVMVDHKEAPETLTALRAEGVLAIKGNITAPETLITAGQPGRGFNTEHGGQSRGRSYCQSTHEGQRRKSSGLCSSRIRNDVRRADAIQRTRKRPENTPCRMWVL